MDKESKRELIEIIIGAAMLAAALPLPAGALKTCLFIAAYIISGYCILTESARGMLKGRVFDENLLMSIATLGALIIGEYPEAVAVMLLFRIGEMFQEYAVDKSRRSISELMDIRPETATVERGGAQVEIPPEEVALSDIIIIKSGEKVPLDGEIVEGTTTLDASALTGESMPRDAAAGDSVISGCINMGGLIRVRPTRLYGDSTVSRILSLIESSSEKKSRSEAFITRFARRYTPAVTIAAALLFVIPPLFAGGSWREWGFRALSFLVVSCPCALVISVPLTFFGGIGGASKNGILVKGGNYLEALAKTDIVVFDKTGTLTKGVFRVSAVHPDAISGEELLRIAATVESSSEHPIARSILAQYAKPVDTSGLSDMREIPGKGLACALGGKTVLAGNRALMETIGVTTPVCPHAGTMVHLAMDGEYIGHIVISDEIKPTSKAAIEALRSEGARLCVMLTGDSEAVARDAGEKLALDRVYAGLLPEQKVAHVEELLGEKIPGGKLIFVGDGINDAPVLTRADVGVAMGALGSDAAVEAADVVLMDDDPEKLALAVRTGRRTLMIARQNIVFALAVKALVLVLVAIGAASMWMAVIADVGVSFLAILNAMRALNMGSPGTQANGAA